MENSRRIFLSPDEKRTSHTGLLIHTYLQEPEMFDYFSVIDHWQDLTLFRYVGPLLIIVAYEGRDGWGRRGIGRGVWVFRYGCSDTGWLVRNLNRRPKSSEKLDSMSILLCRKFLIGMNSMKKGWCFFEHLSRITEEAQLFPGPSVRPFTTVL